MRPKNIEALLNRDPEDHGVYVMGHLVDGVVEGPTKVGVSKNPRYRLKQIQAMESGVIVLVAQFWFWKRTHAFKVEQAFHRACNGWRIRGEWFEMDPMHAIGIMNANLQSFADDFVGADDVGDIWSTYDYLNVPGHTYLCEIAGFGHDQ